MGKQMTRQEIMEKRKASVKSGFVFCEWCGSVKTPEGEKACVRCKGPLKTEKHGLLTK